MTSTATPPVSRSAAGILTIGMAIDAFARRAHFGGDDERRRRRDRLEKRDRQRAGFMLPVGDGRAGDLVDRHSLRYRQHDVARETLDDLDAARSP